MKYLMSVSITLALAFATFAGPAARADQPIDPEALAAAKTILEVTHASAMGDQLMAQLMKIFTTSLNQANLGRTQDISDILTKLILPAFHESLPELLDESARTYARNFTAAELKQLLAFYQTPVGQKLIAQMPEISREQMAVGQAFAQKIMVDVRQKLLDAIKEKGLQAPHGI